MFLLASLSSDFQQTDMIADWQGGVWITGEAVPSEESPGRLANCEWTVGSVM